MRQQKLCSRGERGSRACDGDAAGCFGPDFMSGLPATHTGDEAQLAPCSLALDLPQREGFEPACHIAL